VGASHSATSAIKSALKNVSLDAHWIARCLVTAGGKRIKIRLLDTLVTSHYYIYNKITASLYVQRLLTGKNLRSPAFTSAPVHRQPRAEKRSRLPTCCLLNPACCRPSAPAFDCAQPALFRACTSSLVTTFTICKLPARLHIQQARTVV
jgi:hypothetical protein